MNERDMFYGYGGIYPLPNQFANMNSSQNNTNDYSINYFYDLKNRMDRLERQLKRLDQRLTRIETPYANTNSNNEPDDNMYMM